MFDLSVLTSSATTGLFIGMGWALVKVVNYFISKKKEDDEEKKEQKKYGLTEEQKELLQNINCKTDKCYEMHTIYDENHVPRWFFPGEVLKILREMDIQSQITNKEIIEALGEIKGGQVILVEKLSDLINSQKLMTERLSDLVKRLYKLSD